MPHKRNWRPAEIAIAVVLVGAGAGALFLLFNVPEAGTREMEQWKVETQFLWTIVLGGLIALLYRQWERAAAKKESRRDLTQEFYKSCTRCHNDYKKVRRVLRAARQDLEDGRVAFPEKVFDQAFEKLNEAQLWVESLKREAGLLANLYVKDVELHSRWASVAGNLELIEEYLKGPIDEAIDHKMIKDGERYICRGDSKTSAFSSSSKDGNLERELWSKADKVRENLTALAAGERKLAT